MSPSERDYEIVKARQKGETLSSIGLKYGLTRQRVDAIVKEVKRYAKAAVLNAVRSNFLYRPDECEECGTHCTPDGHHEDYSKPLLVVWLCRSCHSRKHKGFRPDEEDRKARLHTTEVRLLMSPNLRRQIEEAKGLVSLSAWIRDAIEAKLEKEKTK